MFIGLSSKTAIENIYPYYSHVLNNNNNNNNNNNKNDNNDPVQKTRPYDNQQKKKKKRICKCVDFAVSVDHRMNLKEWEKRISTSTLQEN